MSSRRWYAPALILVVVAIGAGAAISIRSNRGWHVWGPFAHRPVRVASTASAPVTPNASAHATPSVVTPAVPTVTHPKAPDTAKAPTSAAASPVAKPARANPVPVWKPSDRQQMRDRVFVAGQQNRPAEAIATLERWDAKHPADPDALRELARLLVRNDRLDEGFERYRQLLAATPPPDTAVRAEYAAALLAAQRYDSAAANYRILITDDTANVDAQLGLARALAWSNRPQEAEPERHWLAQRRPSDSTVVSMLRLARDAYDPGSAEATGWVAEDPAFTRYRLALARAYVREGHPELAAAHFDTVLAADDSAPLALVREAAGAHATAGDSLGNARLLGRAVALSPSDPALRPQYAEALAWAGDRKEATKQYDILLKTNPSPELLIARGQLHELLGDGDAAERDLTQAAAMRPSPEAWVMLGDLYRWRGDAPRAREAYARAEMIH